MKRLILFLSFAALGACGDFSTTLRDTEVTITAPQTSARVLPDSIRINYSAQGRSLNRLIIDYGDGGVDSLGLSGAVTASGFRHHRYRNAGTFIVSGTLQELSGTTAESFVTVNITP